MRLNTAVVVALIGCVVLAILCDAKPTHGKKANRKHDVKKHRPAAKKQDQPPDVSSTDALDQPALPEAAPIEAPETEEQPVEPLQAPEEPPSTPAPLYQGPPDDDDASGSLSGLLPPVSDGSMPPLTPPPLPPPITPPPGCFPPANCFPIMAQSPPLMPASGCTSQGCLQLPPPAPVGCMGAACSPYPPAPGCTLPSGCGLALPPPPPAVQLTTCLPPGCPVLSSQPSNCIGAACSQPAFPTSGCNPLPGCIPAIPLPPPPCTQSVGCAPQVPAVSCMGAACTPPSGCAFPSGCPQQAALPPPPPPCSLCKTFCTQGCVKRCCKRSRRLSRKHSV